MAIQQTAMKNSDTEVADVETFETIVIGGGQAGLSVGYYLKRRGGSFVILDANERIGGSWRTRTWQTTTGAELSPPTRMRSRSVSRWPRCDTPPARTRG